MTGVQTCALPISYWPAFEGDVPYAVVQVRLDEGVRLFSNLLGAPREQIHAGMRVRVSFDAVTPSVSLVKFVPA